MKMSADDAAGLAHARPSSPHAPMGLDQLPRRVAAHVASLQPARDEREQAIVQRLMEIGFLPGEPVRIVASGFPGGDPLAVRIGQATFALRRHEAALVRVQPGEVPA
ncbi:FeoA family protein [Paracidovorax avenae ATCC 19860]|uniref:FeoA family protein n=1 Tax=Paracidovorax avenae (strain ATCC 19860 / DSM 7227 / CCUG 15838 / JCM 20985 / LMG 2117 / NCPPB 1011) TaxID=643561 RepID=F0QCV0_PARA1|nr:FeoA family protein [Paracidovorax avenae ATCC 19860]